MEYYRKITSEMVVNIDRLVMYNATIPGKLEETIEICQRIHEKKAKGRKETERLMKVKDETEQQIKCIEQLLQETQVNKEFMSEKMDKIMAPTQAKMDRLERKMENLESGEYLKVKYVVKNETVVLVVAVVNMLLAEDDVDNVEK